MTIWLVLFVTLKVSEMCPELQQCLSQVELGLTTVAPEPGGWDPHCENFVHFVLCTLRRFARLAA